MLRGIVISVAVTLAGVGLGLVICGTRVPGWQMLIFGVTLFVGTVFERRYHRTGLPSHDWQRTEERFIDPSSGRPVEVIYHARTGERRYVDPSRGAAGESNIK